MLLSPQLCEQPGALRMLPGQRIDIQVRMWTPRSRKNVTGIVSTRERWRPAVQMSACAPCTFLNWRDTWEWKWGGSGHRRVQTSSVTLLATFFPIPTAVLFVLSFPALPLSLGNGGACLTWSPELGLPCRAASGLGPLWSFSVFLCVPYLAWAAMDSWAVKNLNGKKEWVPQWWLLLLFSA